MQMMPAANEQETLWYKGMRDYVCLLFAGANGRSKWPALLRGRDSTVGRAGMPEAAQTSASREAV